MPFRETIKQFWNAARRFVIASAALLLAMFALWSSPALAAGVDAPPPGALAAIWAVLAWALEPAHLATAISLALAGLGLVLGPSVVRRRRVALATYYAFHITEDLHGELPENSTLTKVQMGLQQADAWMVANGWRPLKPGEQTVAKLGFNSLHGEDKVDAKRAALTGAATVAIPHPS